MDSDVTDLVDAASETVPEDTTLVPEMMVEKSAIAYFGRPVRRGLDSEVDGWHFDALAWGPLTVGTTPAVGFVLLTAGLGGWFVIGESIWKHGDVLSASAREDTDSATVVTWRQDRRLAAALWLITSQPGVTESTALPLNRSTRRRMEREFLPTSPIRLLSLRKRGGGETKGGQVDWSHRWIVRGHWRQQPYGTGGSLRRPVWIAPHIKGPEDKPLDTREGVRVA